MFKFKILGLLLLFLCLSWTAQGKKHLIANNPDSIIAQGYFELGNDCRSKGDVCAAERFFLKAINVYPGNAWAYVILGNLYDVDMQDGEKAKPYYLKAIELNANCAEAYALMGSYYYGKYNSTNKYEYLLISRQYSQKAIALAPRMAVSVYNNIGFTFQYEGNCDSAEYYFKKGIELWPKDQHSYTNLAHLYYFQANDIYFDKPKK